MKIYFGSLCMCVCVYPGFFLCKINPLTLETCEVIRIWKFSVIDYHTFAGVAQSSNLSLKFITHPTWGIKEIHFVFWDAMLFTFLPYINLILQYVFTCLYKSLFSPLLHIITNSFIHNLYVFCKAHLPVFF